MAVSPDPPPKILGQQPSGGLPTTLADLPCRTCHRRHPNGIRLKSKTSRLTGCARRENPERHIQMPQFPQTQHPKFPFLTFAFRACGILQGSHKGPGHQLELAVLLEIPALVHLGHEDSQIGLQYNVHGTCAPEMIQIQQESPRIAFPYDIRYTCTQTYICYGYMCVKVHQTTKKKHSHTSTMARPPLEIAKRPQSVRCPPGVLLDACRKLPKS